MTDPAGLSRLNHECRCVSLDRDRLKQALADAGLDGRLGVSLGPEHDNLFANAAVFVDPADLSRMAAVVRGVEELVRTPEYLEVALGRAPAIARHPTHAQSVLFGYDFHLGDGGPQLIEINTNAGGALLILLGARAQRACCPEAAAGARTPQDDAGVEADLLASFREEWRLARGDAPLRRVLVVDDDPTAQFLYPEFVLFRELFRRAGLAAEVAAPGELTFDGVLRHRGEPVDLVYNRCTDFYLEAPEHAALREAYASDAAVLTPHPRAHALYANKHNLVSLSDPELINRAGLSAGAREALLAAVPRARAVHRDDAEALWRERKQWFFKPAAGFGSKAAYRGDKLTRGTFEAILAGDYNAQRTVPPSERLVEVAGAPVPLKVDVRNFAYGGRVQLVAARLYHGQTTNVRTAGGGFATVLTDAASPGSGPPT
jgi:hypothetical protein